MYVSVRKENLVVKFYIVNEVPKHVLKWKCFKKLKCGMMIDLWIAQQKVELCVFVRTCDGHISNLF
jgi:hypothetical protein